MVRFRFHFFFLLLFFLPFTSDAQVGAATGIGLRPATIEEPVNPGDIKRYSVQISNLSGVDQTLYIFSRDISGVKAGGVPIFARDDLEKTGFELSNWISLDVDQIQLAANGSQEVSFTMTVPDDASPGSHFGAIFVSYEPPRLRSTGAAVGYEVANILSMRVAGDADVNAQIRQFSTKNFLYGTTDIDFLLRIENTGNVLVRPIGPLKITNMFGREVALFTFNDSQAGVFPGTIRDFDINWKDDSLGFGRYEARVSPVYGEEGVRRTLTTSVTFWILPMNIIGPSVLVLLVLLASVYFGVRAYVRRTVAQLSLGTTRRLVRSSHRSQGSPFLLVLVSMLATTALFLIVLLILFA